MRQPHDNNTIPFPDGPARSQTLAPPAQPGAHSPPLVNVLERIAVGIEQLNTILSEGGRVNDPSPRRGEVAWSSMAQSLARIADRLDPPPPEVIDSTFVAERLGCTTTWIADLARRHQIPVNCIVPGSGNGKPWKFYRMKIDAWLATR